MSKAFILTDLHIHAHKDRVDRLDHCLEVLNWAFEQSACHGCKHIWFLGDLFHDRIKIDVLSYLKTFEVFMKHMITDAVDRDVYLLVGNHDMYHKERWDVNSVKPLTAIPRVHLIDKPTRMVFDDKMVDWMPHTDNPVRDLNELKKANNGAGDILLGHMAVHGAKLNIFYGTKADVIVEYDNDMVPVDPSIFSDWGMTLLGHYHGAQKVGFNAEFVGSPLELTYGEAFQQKHCIVLDLGSMEKKYVVNNFSPKHFIVSPQDIRDENYKLDGNFIRVSVDGLKSSEIIDLRKEVIMNYKVLSFDTKVSGSKGDEDKITVDNTKIFLQDVNQMIESYMDQRGVPEGMTRSKLALISKKCMEKKN